MEQKLVSSCVKDILEDILKLLCAVVQHTAWNVVWARCLVGVDSGGCPSNWQQTGTEHDRGGWVKFSLGLYHLWLQTVQRSCC